MSQRRGNNILVDFVYDEKYYFSLFGLKKEQIRISNREINRAGDIISGKKAPKDEFEQKESEEIVTGWKELHFLPLMIFKGVLTWVLEEKRLSPIIVGRIKRRESIINKLKDFPSMNLAKMQDIAGLRIIFSDVAALNEFNNNPNIGRYGNYVYSLKNNYIEFPKDTGYRGLHCILKYWGITKSVFDDLSIELQLRTTLQHAWATAVETIGFFKKQKLKSGIGDSNWLYFFRLTSSYFAFKENAPFVPNTPTNIGELKKEIKNLCIQLNVVSQLHALKNSIYIAESKFFGDNFYYLLILNTKTSEFNISGFEKSSGEKALSVYKQLEQENINNPDLNIVLVSAASIEDLRSAYPSYYADMEFFLSSIDEILKDS